MHECVSAFASVCVSVYVNADDEAAACWRFTNMAEEIH